MKLIANATYFLAGSVLFWIAPRTNCPSAVTFFGVLSFLLILLNSRKFWKWYIRKFQR